MRHGPGRAGIAAAWAAAMLALLAGGARHASADRPDAALRIADVIARRVARFENVRALHPLGTWREAPSARWRIRPARICLDELHALGVPHRAWRPMPDPVPAPVKITGPIGGVVFRKARAGAPLFLACEMAARLPAIADVLRAHDVTTADVLSAYRREPAQSFHVMGLGLDLSRFHRAHDALDVERDWVVDRVRPTCRGVAPSAPRARALHEIACALSRTDRFSSVLTPNYDDGHRDHLHLDIRPDDARLFLR